MFVGHDWGALIVWDLARLHPDRVRAVVGVSVPFIALAGPADRTDASVYGDRFFYILYFQQPGSAEGELDADPSHHDGKRAVGRQRLRASRQRRPVGRDCRRWKAPASSRSCREPPARPFVGPEGPWLTDADLRRYADGFAHSGFFGPVSYYRNLDANFDLIRTSGRACTMPVFSSAARTTSST